MDTSHTDHAFGELVQALCRELPDANLEFQTLPDQAAMLQVEIDERELRLHFEPTMPDHALLVCTLGALDGAARHVLMQRMLETNTAMAVMGASQWLGIDPLDDEAVLLSRLALPGLDAATLLVCMRKFVGCAREWRDQLLSDPPTEG